MEKIDGRKLKPESRNELRRLVIRLRQQSGMKAEAWAAAAGVHVSTIRAWLARARSEGISALTEKPRGRPVGACRKLTLAQEMWIRQQVIGTNPAPLSLSFALWTRRAIRDLIWLRFAMEVQDRLIGT